MRAIVADDLRDPERRLIAERAIGGDEAAIQTLVASLSDHFSADKVQRWSAIFRDPPSIIGPARSVLGLWLPLFQPIEDRVRAMIRRDADARAGAIATLRPTDLIEATTGGIRWLAEPGIRRVILAPSYFARPYNFVLAGDDWRMFGYPIADDALDAGDPLAPPAAVVRLHRALGDETRLRILRLLAGARPLPDRDRGGSRAVEADHQAPPRAPPGRRPGHPDRGGRAVVLQPAARDDRSERTRVDRVHRQLNSGPEAAAAAGRGLAWAVMLDEWLTGGRDG